MEYVIDFLNSNRDEKYASFQRRLLPTVAPEAVIGVRTPVLRKMAKDFKNDERCAEFLNELPHKYFEENQLHGFIISGIKDFQACVDELNKFLPYVDNWATCDQTSPRVFKRSKQELIPQIEKWLSSNHTYTVRFAIGMLMQHFLDGDFNCEYVNAVAAVSSDEYYIKTEIAWYMATALSKQWDSVIPYIEENRLDVWVHNKTIQKAKESFRITKEQKDYLSKLKR